MQKYIMLTLLIAAFASGFTAEHWRSGNEIRDIKLLHEKQLSAAQRSVMKTERLYRAITIKYDALAVQQAELAKQTNRVIVKKVIEYVQSNTDKCELSANWVRTHNYAAGGVPAD